MAGESSLTGSAMVVALKTATLALGATITYFALKAYRRKKSPALRALTVGFSLVTTGAVFAGAIHQFSPLNLHDAILVESLFITFGFLVLTYSLYARPY